MEAVASSEACEISFAFNSVIFLTEALVNLSA